MEIKIRSMKEKQYNGQTVLLRLDINSPIDPKTHKIVNRNRLEKSIATLNYLLDSGAKVAIIAHQGDTLDYQNLIPLTEHAEILTTLSGHKIEYIDDVCGIAAIEKVKSLQAGEAVILGNLRYLTEEISSFEEVVKLTATEMLETWLIRKLAPLFDAYVNEAFAAAHRNCPSMVAFQEVLPSAAGDLFFQEYEALSSVLYGAKKPAVFVLGGAKISDAFGMIEQVLQNGTADKILTCGVTGVIFILASGQKVGQTYEKWLDDRKLLGFVEQAKKYLAAYPDKIVFPQDLAYAKDGVRLEIPRSSLPLDEASFLDIGSETVNNYSEIIKNAKTIFGNGPAGVYEDELFEKGTKSIFQAIAVSDGYSVIGGGDSVSAASKFIALSDISYVCTAGGAMVRFMTGKPLPLIAAMEKAYNKEK